MLALLLALRGLPHPACSRARLTRPHSLLNLCLLLTPGPDRPHAHARAQSASEASFRSADHSAHIVSGVLTESLTASGSIFDSIFDCAKSYLTCWHSCRRSGVYPAPHVAELCLTRPHSLLNLCLLLTPGPDRPHAHARAQSASEASFRSADHSAAHIVSGVLTESLTASLTASACRSAGRTVQYSTCS